MSDDPAPIRAALAAGQVRRVLAVRVARVGDTLAVLPALELLRAALPAAELVLLCSSYAAPLLARGRSGPGELSLVEWPHRGRGLAAWRARRAGRAALAARGPFDLWLGLEDKPWGRRLAAGLGIPRRWATSSLSGYQLAGCLLGGHLVERKAGVLRPLGLWERGAPPWVRLSPDPARAEAAARELASLPAPRIGLQCGSYGARHLTRGRRDPHPAWIAALGRLIARELGGSLVLQSGLGGPEAAAARAVAEDLTRAGAPHRLLSGLDLPGLHAHLAALDALVSANTGPAHLAAAAGTPVVLLEGPSTPLARPWCPPARLRVLRRDLACSPCRGAPHGRLCQVPRCLDELDPQAALAALHALLSGDPAGPASRAAEE